MPNSAPVSTVTETHLSPTLVNQIINDATRLVAKYGAGKTIAAGVITVGAGLSGESLYVVANEAAAAADDLDTITGGVAGDVIMLLGTAGQVTTLKHGTGNIQAPAGNDLVLSTQYPTMLVRNGGANWILVTNSHNETRGIFLQVVDPAMDCDATNGNYQFPCPKAFNGMDLVRAMPFTDTAGVTNATTVQIRNMTKYPANDALSTAMSIASGATKGTEGVVNLAYDNVSTDDLIRILVTANSTTKAKGLKVVLEYRAP